MMFFNTAIPNLIDGFDGYTYNNYYAAGNQAHPSGINKYYDMNSWGGIFLCAIDASYIWFWDALSIFTLGIPIYRWIEIFQWFEGTLLDYDWALLFIPSFLWGIVGPWWVTVDKGVWYG